MQKSQEEIIRQIYEKFKLDKLKNPLEHIAEEDLACFAQGKLEQEKSLLVKEHLIGCKACAEAFSIFLKLNDAAIINAEEGFIEGLENLVLMGNKNILEIIIKAKDDFLELVSTSGNILVGQELISAPLLRSRKISNFKNEIIILEDFDNDRVEIKVNNNGGKSFSLNIVTSKRNNPGFEKDLRFSLLKGTQEIESYVSDSGSAVFDQVLPGKYLIEITGSKIKLASIALDISI